MLYTCFTPYILCQSFPCLLPVCFSRHPVLFLVLPARLPACPEPGFLPAPFGPCFCEPFLLIKECFFVIAFCVPACLSAPEPHPITKTCQNNPTMIGSAEDSVRSIFQAQEQRLSRIEQLIAGYKEHHDQQSSLTEQLRDLQRPSEPLQAGCGSRSPDGPTPPAPSGYQPKQPSPFLSDKPRDLSAPRLFTTLPWQPPAFLSRTPRDLSEPRLSPAAASAVLQPRPIPPAPSPSRTVPVPPAPSPSRTVPVPRAPSPCRTAPVPPALSKSRPAPVPRAPSLPPPALVPPIPSPSRPVVVPCFPQPSRSFPLSHTRLSRRRSPLSRFRFPVSHRHLVMLQFPVSCHHPSRLQTPAPPVPGTPATHSCTPPRTRRAFLLMVALRPTPRTASAMPLFPPPAPLHPPLLSLWDV
ncbi:hypothetical protein EYF80_059931 [Liparis tanakae]|uniref:Uncharacterized protein n=1 Tax=Liparis tanakae TaxID=230148 RepID=A0A4Z2EMW9_9TELE|nr:hypothetical protein EYF80_059931 [Liparis tanakae]